MPRYTKAARREIKWLVANLKTALLHEFTSHIANGEEEELCKKQHKVTRALADLGIFGRINAAVKVSNWAKEARQLVEIYRGVAPEGMGRETVIVDLILDMLCEAVAKSQMPASKGA